MTKTIANPDAAFGLTNDAFNLQTSNYILQAEDANEDRVVQMLSGSANTVTIPPHSAVPFPVGAYITIQQLGAGATTIVAGSGVTGTAASALVGGQYQFARIVQRAVNVWDVVGGAAALSGTFVAQADDIAPAYGMTAAHLSNFKKAAGGVLAGTRAAKILCVGDSTTWGRLAGTDGNPLDSWPHWLEKLMSGVPGFAVPPPGGGLDDPRYVFGTDWSVAAFGFGNGSAILGTLAAAGALTFTPGTLCDTFDVYFLTGPSNGTVQASVGGATATPVVTTDADAGWSKIVVTAPGLSVGHTLTLQTVTDGPVYISGISAYDSTNPGLRICNAAVTGTTSGDWADTGDRASLNGIRAVAPDLTIIALGVNDAIGGAVSSATWQANITAIAEAAQESGDVLLLTCVPSENGTKAARELVYQQATAALAASLGCGWVDIWTLFGGSYATANALGFMADSDHPSELGYAVMARAVGEALSMTPPMRLPYAPVAPLGIVRSPWMPYGLSGALNNGVDDTMWYYRVVEGGTISKVRIHIAVNSGQVCCAAYANSGEGLDARPTGGLLASSGAVTPSGTGAQDIPLGKSVTLQAGDWIAIGWDNTTATAYALDGIASSLLGGEVCSQGIFPAPAIPSSLTIQGNRLFTFVGVP